MHSLGKTKTYSCNFNDNIMVIKVARDIVQTFKAKLPSQTAVSSMPTHMIEIELKKKSENQAGSQNAPP